MCRQKDADDPNMEKLARKLEKLGPPERWGPHNECLVRGTTYSSGGGRLPKSLHFADSDVTIGVGEGEKCPQSRLWTSLRLSGVVTGRGLMR
jgi:hypothetical protein